MQFLNNEITISVLFVLLLLVFLDPIMVLMPSQTLYLAMAGAVVLFALFAGLVWRERALDERDELHRMLAGLLLESASGHVDPWLIYGLGAMVTGKLLGLFWSRNNR